MHIYHIIPEPFLGHSLIPLNHMDKSSELYKKNVQKYKGREELLDVNIPILNCKWNDVVHFSAIDPTLIATEILKINPDQKPRKAKYFKIHIDQIVNQYKSVVYNRPYRNSRGFQVNEDEVTTLVREIYKELTTVPPSTIEYWKEAQTNNGPLLWFMHIPHILVMGEVATADFEICELAIN